ncbi:MAG: hypothetical protein WC862_00005 [Patescibacteria group bacterium]
MDAFGWSDPVETRIRVAYRRKGERQDAEFSGPVFLLTGTEQEMKHVPRAELPLRDGLLDLTTAPVVGIGGKRKHQPARVREFLAGNPGFHGVFLLYPGSGNWDLGSGMLLATSREILSGKRVSGGRPEVQFTNYRWLRDGRYVADSAKMLHGKVLETIETAVEQEPGAEKIAEALTGWSCSFDHRLHEECKTVASELHDLESRRVIFSGENTRDMTALVRGKLSEKLQGVRFVRDIPESVTVTAEEVAPELVVQAETLGTIEIPGLGRRLLTRQYVKHDQRRSNTPTVMLAAEEFRRITAWPFGDRVYPALAGLSSSQFSWTLREILQSPEAERLGKIREYFSRKWLDHERSSNRPRDEKVTNPLEADPPTTPSPVVWGNDLITGEAFTAYAALYHDVRGAKGRIVDSGWSIRWYDDADEAAKTDAEARREAGSYITARRLEAELTANAKAVELPVAVPASYVAPSHTPQKVLAMAGFTSDQYRIREDVGHWYSRGWSGGRDHDGEWYDGCSSTGSFVRKGDDGVWEIGQSGPQHLFEGGSVGDWNQRAFAQPVLSEMGAGEKIATIQAQITADREASEESYRAAIRSFVSALQALPAYASLSSDMRAKLDSLASISWGTPSIDEAELRLEWAKAEALYARERTGEVLTNWGGHYRVMGATGNCDYWVVRPDGALRDPDGISYRKRYTSEGNKQWRLVGPEELALSWSKGCTADPHRFAINKLPAGGCTAEQLATVEHLEREISKRFEGAVGMSGKPSPGIGEGWNLVKKPCPNPPAVLELETSVPAEELKPIDLKTVDLSKLFGGAAKTRR